VKPSMQAMAGISDATSWTRRAGRDELERMRPASSPRLARNSAARNAIHGRLTLGAPRDPRCCWFGTPTPPSRFIVSWRAACNPHQLARRRAMTPRQAVPPPRTGSNGVVKAPFLPVSTPSQQRRWLSAAQRNPRNQKWQDSLRLRGKGRPRAPRRCDRRRQAS
jgi:hypothetical protein